MKRTKSFGVGLMFLEFGIIFIILSYSLPSTFPESFSSVRYGGDLGLLFIGFLSCLIGTIIVIAVSFTSRATNLLEEKKSFGRSINLKDTVVGMAKAEGRVNMKFLSSNTAMAFDDFKVRIYDLLGKDLLEGTIEGDFFVPTGDISASIDALFQQFALWESGKKI